MIIRGTNALLTLSMCRKVLRKVDRRDRDAADETLRAVVERVSEQLNHQLVRPSKRIDYANLAAATVPPLPITHHPSPAATCSQVLQRRVQRALQVDDRLRFCDERPLRGRPIRHTANMGADAPHHTATHRAAALTPGPMQDTAGQERFQSLGVAFYRGSDCCVLVRILVRVFGGRALRRQKVGADADVLCGPIGV